MLKAEWKYLLNHKLMFGILCVIMLIPMLYTTIFLSSMWDPYEKVDQLPVAVINQDQAVTYQGQKIDIGNRLVKNLKQKKSFKFYFKADKQQAEKDLKSGKYYMVITIPKNFSKDSTSIFTTHPKKMTLDYSTNYGSSYVAGKMSSSGAEKIQNSLAKTITKQYIAAIFSNLHDLQQGLSQAANANTQLAKAASQGGSATAPLAAGNQKLAQSLTQANKNLQSISFTKKNIDTLTNPIQLHSHDVSTVPNNGTAMTPYMMSVALFVGCLTLNMMYDVAAPRKKPKNGFSWWGAKMSVIGLFAILQAVIAYYGLKGFLGLNPIHPGATLGLVIAASFAFSSLVTLLVAAFGKAGAFLSLILLMLQLSGSAGTYPIQLSNSFFETIHPYLPLSYSVQGLKESIMIGTSAANQILVLIGIGIVSSLLMIIVFHIRTKKKLYLELEI